MVRGTLFCRLRRTILAAEGLFDLVHQFSEITEFLSRFLKPNPTFENARNRLKTAEKQPKTAENVRNLPNVRKMSKFPKIFKRRARGANFEGGARRVCAAAAAAPRSRRGRADAAAAAAATNEFREFRNLFMHEIY